MRTTTIAKRLGAFSILVGVAVVVSGCTASVSTGTSATKSANVTVAAEDIAALGATALSTEWDAEATMDCGDGSVDSVEGTEVDCTAYNPNSGLDYPATVTLTKIDGSDYTVSVVTGAAIVPESEETESGAEEGTEGADDTTTAPADAPTVSGDSLEAVVVPALEEDLGYKPGMDCGTEPIAIYLDAEIQCVATADDGLEYATDIVITEVTATDYKLNARMLSAPLE